MSEWGWVIAAYALTWAVLIGHAMFAETRLRRARAELATDPDAVESP